MTDSIKCPNCGANLIFDADLQKMRCSFCSSTFTAEELDNKIVPEAEPDTNAGDRMAKEGAEEKIRKSLSDKGVQFVCNSCGATVVTDQHTSATFCAFCGSPAVIQERLSDEFSPDYVVPFRFGKDEAIKKFFEWCKGGRWTPLDFCKEENIEKLTGLYVPFWLYDVNCLADVTAEGKDCVVSSCDGETVETTTTYEVHRKLKLSWNKIPFDAEKRIDDKIMEAIGPFRFSDIKEFDPAYLQGFFAERYDQQPKDQEIQLRGRIRGYIDEEMMQTFRKYNQSFHIVTDNTTIHEPKQFYGLLPVWFLHYEYHGKSYEFCMNGQTGKIHGTPPVSRLKLIVLFFVVLTLAAALTRLLVGLFMGGFVG